MKNYILLISAFFTLQIQAQDLIYSQFNAMPLALNPAFAGNNSCNYRFSAIGRSQWSGINNVKSYQSATLAGDVNINNNIDDQINLWGAGAMLSYDKASVGSFTNLMMVGNLAYHIRFGREANNFLSLGIQAGAGQRGVNASSLVFGDQLDDFGRFVGGTKETITNESKWYPELGFGALLTLNPNDNTNMYFGSSILHLLNPNVSFTNDEYKLPVRFNFHAGGNFLHGNYVFLPSVYVQYQQLANYNIGTYAGTYLSAGSETTDPTIGYLGLWYKSQDAIAAALRLDIGKMSLAFSYDIHTGGVARNLNAIGSPELSINYYGCFQRDTRRSGCPRL